MMLGLEFDLKWRVMKSGEEIREFQDLETHLTQQRGLTSNRVKISLIMSIGISTSESFILRK